MSLTFRDLAVGQKWKGAAGTVFMKIAPCKDLMENGRSSAIVCNYVVLNGPHVGQIFFLDEEKEIERTSLL